MCMQLEVLKKIRKAGKMNGYAVELAEAQAEDFVKMQKEIKNIKKDVTDIKKTQIEQGTKIDLILQRLNGTTDALKNKGIVAEAVMPLLKSWKVWCIAIFFLICVALAGDKVLEIIRWVPTGA